MKHHEHDGKERRRYLRIPFWADIHFQVTPPPSGHMDLVSIEYPQHRPMPEDSLFSIARGRNISAGGLLLDVPQELKPGMFLTLDITMSLDAPPVNIQAVVMRVKQGEKPNEYQIAVNFTSSNDEEMRKIADFVERYYL
ncbi:MAG: PilZ domain-containing protein [Candidatus Aureabacteria bacterium]|nr:PilZ domain-containing protein [Candidatus Auribacterota bacterium]